MVSLFLKVLSGRVLVVRYGVKVVKVAGQGYMSKTWTEEALS